MANDLALDLSEWEVELWPPAQELSLSDWADQHFYLSPESSAEPGRWKTLAYQRAIMDSITDPDIERITWMKSARVGATKIMNATIAYYMAQDPCPILVVQPTIEDAEGYSKEEIAPMLRDCAVLDGLVKERKGKTPAETILHKIFPGGLLSIVGANSGRGFRRVSRRVVIFDEVDGYPPSAGAEGDQIKLGIRRSEFYAYRKIIAASTPLVAGVSRIEEMFEQGDQRYYHVPCPHCGHMDILVFREGERGHWMQWDPGQPDTAHFVCKKSGCVIEHQHKRWMLERGEWRADAPEVKRHASFKIWAAYSVSPNATWSQLAKEFLEANHSGPEQLKTFVNTVLGETWHDRGDAPEWERIYQRREPYLIGSIPQGVRFLTAGVDVQKDRFVYEIVGWSETKESWSIDAGVLMGDTAAEATWAQLDELLGRTYAGPEERILSIATMAVDSGYNTQQVYTWARRHPMSRVIATKGMVTERSIVGVPSAVDVTIRGKKLSRGYKVWPVGVGIAKSELYGWLRLPASTGGEPAPPGFCHFPEYPEEFFRQLTAEHLVTIRKRSGFTALEWQLIPNRENHWLDARILARVAASVQGLDRYAPRVAPNPRPPAPVPQPVSAPAREPRQRSGGWLRGGSGWLGKRR